MLNNLEHQKSPRAWHSGPLIMAQIQERTTFLAADTTEITFLSVMTTCSSNLWMKQCSDPFKCESQGFLVSQFPCGYRRITSSPILSRQFAATSCDVSQPETMQHKIRLFYFLHSNAKPERQDWVARAIASCSEGFKSFYRSGGQLFRLRFLVSANGEEAFNTIDYSTAVIAFNAT
jgi:hypothetical protein